MVKAMSTAPTRRRTMSNSSAPMSGNHKLPAMGGRRAVTELYMQHLSKTSIKFSPKQSCSWSLVGTFLLLCCVMILWCLEEASLSSSLSNTVETTTKYKYPLPHIPDSITAFPDDCGEQVHTYIFKNGKVKWASHVSVYSYEHRGLSVHCMLSRAALRLPKEFETSIRIGLSDKDPERPLSFVPATRVDKMQSETPPLLFPDSTWESWPEVHDYSLPQSMAAVLEAAERNGLPGSSNWKSGRKSLLTWRGSGHGKERVELMNHSSPLFNIQAIEYNLTDKGMKLTSSNQLSRSQHCEYKFLLHMNGIFNDRYSSAIKWKLLCGSLVFVPTEPLYVEWWNYGLMIPYKHFVPFTNAVDLLERVQYYSKHQEEAQEIAFAGMELAKQALEGVGDWIDQTLLYYASKTKHLSEPKICTNPKSSSRLNMTADFLSLQELQVKYGPTVCA